MFEKDNAQSAINAKVSEVKSAITLDAESQSPKYSGHESADYGNGGSSAAGPKGVGATSAKNGY